MILRYLEKKEWSIIFVCVILIVMQVWMDLEIPDYMRKITTLLQTGGTVDEVIGQGWPMLACALASLILAIVVAYFAAYVATSLAQRLRSMQFAKVQSFSAREMHKFSTASLITRSTNDLTQVQMALAMSIPVLIKAPILAAWAIAKIEGESWEWTLTTAIVLIVMIAIVAVIMKLVVPRFKKIQWLTDDVNRNMRENLTGIRVVRAHNAEEYQEKKFDEANKNLTDVNLFTSRTMAFMMPVMTAIMSIFTLAVYWLGAMIIGNAAPGDQIGLFSDMIVFMSYAMQIVLAFIMTIIVFIILPRAIVSAGRIEEVINTEPDIKDGDADESPTDVRGEIEFRNVSFKYPGAEDYVLKNISFTVEQGKTIAFIGSTGSGKSTIANLIMRFYDVTEGQILVDRMDIREYTQNALHRKIGYVPQKAKLFKGTVSSNVAYGDMSEERSEEDIKTAIAIAQSTDFVEKMEGSYEGIIAQEGTNISGGQKQRLSIARAICRKPEIYIFDDSFSALDYKTDRALRNALKKSTSNVTNVIVAQRIGTIMDADSIVVLNEGSIAGQGTHGELLNSCSVYREIASSQLSEEELRK